MFINATSKTMEGNFRSNVLSVWQGGNEGRFSGRKQLTFCLNYSYVKLSAHKPNQYLYFPVLLWVLNFGLFSGLKSSSPSDVKTPCDLGHYRPKGNANPNLVLGSLTPTSLLWVGSQLSGGTCHRCLWCSVWKSNGI